MRRRTPLHARPPLRRARAGPIPCCRRAGAPQTARPAGCAPARGPRRRWWWWCPSLQCACVFSLALARSYGLFAGGVRACGVRGVLESDLSRCVARWWCVDLCARVVCDVVMRQCQPRAGCIMVAAWVLRAALEGQGAQGAREKRSPRRSTRLQALRRGVPFLMILSSAFMSARAPGAARWGATRPRSGARSAECVRALENAPASALHSHRGKLGLHNIDSAWNRAIGAPNVVSPGFLGGSQEAAAIARSAPAPHCACTTRKGAPGADMTLSDSA